MSNRTLQTIARHVSRAPLTFPIAQKRFAATVLQKPKIVDLSRELYHRCLNHPFHVPFVGSRSRISTRNTELTDGHNADPSAMGHSPAQSRRQRYFTLRLLRVDNV